MSDFRAAVTRLGLSQRAFVRLVAALSGRPPQYRTIERWSFKRNPPDVAWALLALMERCPDVWRSIDTNDQPPASTS